MRRDGWFGLSTPVPSRANERAGLAKTKMIYYIKASTAARLDRVGLNFHNDSVTCRGHVVKLAVGGGGGEKY